MLKRGHNIELHEMGFGKPFAATRKQLSIWKRQLKMFSITNRYPNVKKLSFHDFDGTTIRELLNSHSNDLFYDDFIQIELQWTYEKAYETNEYEKKAEKNLTTRG